MFWKRGKKGMMEAERQEVGVSEEAEAEVETEADAGAGVANPAEEISKAGTGDSDAIARLTAEVGELRTLLGQVSERGRVMEAQFSEYRAAQVNRQNRELSSGGLQEGREEYFSPDEVRAMDAGQVRAQYDKILASMRHWH